MKTRDWLLLFLLWSLLAWTSFAQQGLRSGSFVAGVIGGTTSAPAGFTDPSSVSGLQFWFKSETIPGSEGDFISGWPSSASSYPLRYATNTTGSYLWQPQKTNTFGTLSGTNALRFDGLEQFDFLKVNDALGYSSNIASCSVFVVYDSDANAASKILWFASRGTAWPCLDVQDQS